MKLYAPTYYKAFRCIADRCEHSCCIGWEIDVDGDTLAKYQTMTDGYGRVIAESISAEDTPHFRLCEGDRCPHLDERGLCRIITHVGEEALCDVCREHPRFYNYTGAVEVGLGLSCPEAARIVLSSPDYAMVEEVGEATREAEGLDFDGRVPRGEIYAILQGADGLTAALEEIYRRYDLEVGDDGRWLGILDSLEYLDGGHKALFMKYSSAARPAGKEIEAYLSRFFAYLVYRHVTEAFDAEDFRARVSFCLFGERLLASLICAEGATSLSEVVPLAVMISEELEYSEENTLALTY